MGAGANIGGPAILRDGRDWILSYEQVICRRPAGRGIGYLVFLMSLPGEEISALVLERIEPTSRERPRRTALHDARERARKHVETAIGVEIAAIALEHPALARHLREAVSTGVFCSYRRPALRTTPLAAG